MTTKRPVTWFLTEQGRKFSFAVVTSSGILFTAARFVPQTFFLEKYKNFVHYYNNGKPVPLPTELSERCQQCLDILNISDVHRKLISPFSVFGYDLFHAGSSKSKFGVAIGIPVNFTYKSLADIEHHDVMVNQKPVDWTSEAGKKLADAIILPPKVQQFAICREILMTHNHKLTLESIYPFAAVFMAFTMSQYLNRRLNLYAAPPFIRFTLYAIVGVFSTGTYLLMKDITEVHYETKADKQLCALGKDFVESGVVFYTKMLQRNQALRELMGKEGERKYSKLGNENFGLRHPRLALVHRKQYFEERLKELNEAQESLNYNA